MGMFDEIQCRAMSCPGCGGDLGWQTKDAGRNLDRLFIADLMHGRNELSMHGACEDCRWFVRAVISRDTSQTVPQMVWQLAEARGSVPQFDAHGSEGGTAAEAAEES